MSQALPPVVCSICTELFLFSNHHEADQLIGAAPCGHTFHLNCLNQWLANSATCPQCRTSTRKKNAIRLFFDHPAFPDSDTASQVASLTDGTITRLNSRINELNDQLQSKSSALEKARAESTRLAENLASSKQLGSKAKAACDEEKSKNKILRKRLEEVMCKTNKVNDLMQQNEMLTRKVSLLDALQKTAIDECESEIEKLLDTENGKADLRVITTWLAVTSRELRSSQNKVKAMNDEMKKLRDRLAAEKVRCSSLSEDLRQRNEDLTRCENELKSAEDRLKKQQVELTKYRTGNMTPAARPDKAKSASSACRDIFESPMASGLTPDIGKINVTENNDENDVECEIVEVSNKKSRVAAIKSLQEPSPVTPNSVTEFRKVAAKALRGSNAAAAPPAPRANVVPAPPMRGGYNGLGGHSMTFTFPVPKPNVGKSSKPFLTFPSQSGTKRKL